MSAELLTKAEENIKVAVYCGQNGHYNAWANRAWYSIHQLGSIYLQKNGKCKNTNNNNPDYHPHYTHSFLCNELCKYFKHKNEKELYQAVASFQDFRNISDYCKDRIVEETDFKELDPSFVKLINSLKSLT